MPAKICPKCGNDLKYVYKYPDAVLYSLDIARFPCFCDKCEWSGYETYRMVFLEFVDAGWPHDAPKPEENHP